MHNALPESLNVVLHAGDHDLQPFYTTEESAQDQLNKKEYKVLIT